MYVYALQHMTLVLDFHMEYIYLWAHTSANNFKADARIIPGDVRKL